jgi:hypothetical protein
MTRHDENRMWARYNAATIRADRRKDAAPYLAIVALCFLLAAMFAAALFGAA